MDRVVVKLDIDSRGFTKGKDENLGTLAVSITNRTEVDEIMITIAPKRTRGSL